MPTRFTQTNYVPADLTTSKSHTPYLVIQGRLTKLLSLPQELGRSGGLLQQLRTGSAIRDLAAWLARHVIPATLRQLTIPFGLSHPDSASNLARRAEQRIAKSSRYRKDVERLRKALEMKQSAADH